MNMMDFYRLTMKESVELKKTVASNGIIAGTKWNKETYRNNILIKYEGDVYQIDSVLGIVDINDTSKDLEGYFIGQALKGARK